MKKLLICIAAALLIMSGCAKEEKKENEYVVGICNYVSDASLDQIVENIEAQLKVIEEENGIVIKVKYDNANADANVTNQIIANFIADDVDVMIGVATPVAIAMQAATEDNEIPVVFSAVSNPDYCGLIENYEKPGANITGTSDHLDTKGIFNLMFAADPDITKVGLLYDVSQDASTVSIMEAKEILDKAGVEYVEATGTNVQEVTMAVKSLIDDGVEAIFTPTDNTIMIAELTTYESMIEAKIPHYCGADSFALNGAFLGYGVNYAELGKETANIVKEILVDGKNPGDISVRTFDNGTATINIDTCAALGFDFDELSALFAGKCGKVVSIETAESFE